MKMADVYTVIDYTNSLPDECLSIIFTFLTTTNDRNNSSLVSHRWLRIDAQTRTHLTLTSFIPSLFTRFNSLTHLVLRDNTSTSSVATINDNAMLLITCMCPNLTRLKLRECGAITDSCMALFSKNCNKLKEFSCVYCEFSDFGLFELLRNCSQLEVLSVKVLLGSSLCDFEAPRNLRAAKSLKVIKLRRVYNVRLFEPLIIGSKNLKRLKLIHCGGICDRLLEVIRDHNCLAEVHLGKLRVTDVGVSSLGKCRGLVAFSIFKNRRFTDAGLIRFVERCKGLRRLYIDDWNWDKIGNEGLIAVGKHSVNLQELVLIGVNASCVSLEVIATNCQNLVRLELRRSDTITDLEMMCIAEKCVALKILCIEGCGVSNKGIEALPLGCPNLVNIRVTKCRKVTREVGDLLRAKRGSLVVKVDAYETKVVNAITSELVSTSSRPSENGGSA